MLIILCILLVAIDQASKMYFAGALAGGKVIKVIDGFLQFNYAENHGAAFSILQGKQSFLIVCTIVIIIVMSYYIWKAKLTMPTKVSLVLIISGAIGNLIDRVRFNYVIDFVDVKFGTFYDYPIFNGADCFVVVGTILFAYLIFTDKYMMKE